jgi:2-C-methyl-D-erythritol 4-phosphate cytidylyltransferase
MQLSAMIKKIAVIVAAGNGTRMGTDTPKQFLLLRDKPVVWHSIAAFQNAFEDIRILLVVSQEHFTIAEQIRTSSAVPENIKLVPGGKTRFESVRNGLSGITEKEAVIFVHDGVRCLISPDLIHRCFKKAVEAGNAIPAVAPVDSVRIETSDGNETLRRDQVKMIQTPQTFFGDILKTAFQQDYQESFTDEAAVVERLGIKINLVEGEPANIKITTALDLVIAENLLSSKERASGERK